MGHGDEKWLFYIQSSCLQRQSQVPLCHDELHHLAGTQWHNQTAEEQAEDEQDAVGDLASARLMLCCSVYNVSDWQKRW